MKPKSYQGTRSGIVALWYLQEKSTMCNGARGSHNSPTDTKISPQRAVTQILYLQSCLLLAMTPLREYHRNSVGSAITSAPMRELCSLCQFKDVTILSDSLSIWNSTQANLRWNDREMGLDVLKGPFRLKRFHDSMILCHQKIGWVFTSIPPQYSTQDVQYLSIYPSFYASIYPFIHLSIFLCIYLSIHPSIYPKSIHLSMYLSIHSSTYSSILLSVCLSISSRW